MVLTAELRFLVEEIDFLFFTASRPSFKPTKTLIQWVLVALSLMVDHSSQSSAEGRNGGVILELLHTSS
jgi:hypothetical protein